MATRMKQRRGTAAQWTSTNNQQGPILEAGEIGFESDTGKFKIGDGANRWIALPYFLDENDLGGSLGDYVQFSDLGVAGKAASLDLSGKLELDQLPSSVATDTEVTNAVNTAVTNLIGGAPGTLDTLQELAAAINNDPDFFSNLDALPTQSGNAGKYLTTDGTTASWAPAATETPHPFAMIG